MFFSTKNFFFKRFSTLFSNPYDKNRQVDFYRFINSHYNEAYGLRKYTKSLKRLKLLFESKNYWRGVESFS